MVVYHNILYKTEKTFKNEQRSKDVAAKKRPTTSGVGKINNYYEDIYIPPYNTFKTLYAGLYNYIYFIFIIHILVLYFVGIKYSNHYYY